MSWPAKNRTTHAESSIRPEHLCDVMTCDLQESNLKHSINGYMFCNLPNFEAKVGQRVRCVEVAAAKQS